MFIVMLLKAFILFVAIIGVSSVFVDAGRR